MKFGDNVMLGPNVQIYTATHAITVVPRINLVGYGKSVRTGHNV